jgi:hypothetical protein
MIHGEDDYTRCLEYDQGVTLWRVQLSDGRIIVQDDGRPGEQEPSAWLRLSSYLKDNPFSIERFWLQFRSHHLLDILPLRAPGYFFSKGLAANLSGSMVSFYQLGFIQEDRLMVGRWVVPDLVFLGWESRPIPEDYMIWSS